MARIQPVSNDTSDPNEQKALALVRGVWGSNWNMTNTIANNPKILEGFIALWKSVEASGLSKTDREVICMEMARINGCHYCIPAHRWTSRSQGVDTDMVEIIASGTQLSGDGREATMQRFIRRIHESRGKLSDAELSKFLNLGISIPNMIAVIAEIAHCTITNFTNGLAQTELDSKLEKYKDGQP